jgi:hypothetical protein
MNKQKRFAEMGFRENLLQAQAFDHTVLAKPRQFTHHMTRVVRYPKLIYDIGRTVDVRRAGDNRLAFELRQKRYLGRGTYTISARAKGFITYDDERQQTRITGIVHLGGQYVTLLSIMTLFVLVSLTLIFVTLLFLPLALLMLAVLALHWSYLFADRRDLQEQLAHLVDLTERENRLMDRDIDSGMIQATISTQSSLRQENL